MVKNQPASAEVAGDKILIPWLGRPLEEEMATHSRTLAWRIPWAEEPGRCPTGGAWSGSFRTSSWGSGLAFQAGSHISCGF